MQRSTGRRGQLQALEPILIVIVLVIIAGIGLLFYVRISGQQAEKDRTVATSQEDLTTLSYIARMPELSCPDDVPATNCIDKLKAERFAAKLQSDPAASTYYHRLFGASNVTITWLEMDGSASATSSIQLYDGQRRNNTRQTTTYFTVYDPIRQELDFAVMTIRRER